ncbi:MAG TPA: hypothetical protein VNG35_16500 [Gemmatimonadales bacterium]|nr:hypothetical protein [Gemmatimonadales bacterium]
MNRTGLTKEALRRLIWRAKVTEAIDGRWKVTSVLTDRVRCGDVASWVAEHLEVSNSWRHRRECRQAVADLGCKRVSQFEGCPIYLGLRRR